MQHLLTFPKPRLPLDEAARLAEKRDVDTLYNAIVEASHHDVTARTVLDHAKAMDWSRDLTVMMMAYALLVKSHELQGHVLELLMTQPAPQFIVVTPDRMAEIEAGIAAK